MHSCPHNMSICQRGTFIIGAQNSSETTANNGHKSFPDTFIHAATHIMTSISCKLPTHNTLMIVYVCWLSLANVPVTGIRCVMKNRVLESSAHGVVTQIDSCGRETPSLRHQRPRDENKHASPACSCSCSLMRVYTLHIQSDCVHSHGAGQCRYMPIYWLMWRPGKDGVMQLKD